MLGLTLAQRRGQPRLAEPATGPDLDGEHIFEPDDAPGITQQQIRPLRRSW